MTFDLAEPVLVNRSVAFDGILAHLVWRRTGDAETAHLDLPLAQTDGVYQASELLFLGPVHRRAVHQVMNPRWDRFELGSFAHKRGKTVEKITARDRRKPTLDRYEAVAARRAFVLGRGDIAAVEDLLTGLDAVGKKAVSRGFGRVRHVRIDTLAKAPESLGFTDFDGRPIRVTPKTIWTKLNLRGGDVSFGMARPRLPRWATADELCALPASHIVQPHQTRRIGL